jgi:hypothetical protein
MELRLKSKILFLTLAVCIAFSVIFSVILITANHEHDCIGESCPICLQIETVNNFHKTLKIMGFIASLALILTHLVRYQQKYTEFTPCPYSPIVFKVRSNS